MMRYNVFFSIMFLCGFNVYAQSPIKCNLIELSKLTFDKSPIIQRNELQIQNAKGGVQVQRSAFDYQLSSAVSLRNNRSNLFDADPRNNLFGDDFIKTNSADFSIGLQRKFRTGLTAGMSLDYGQLSNNYPFNQFSQEVGAFISDHTVSSTFSLTQPLIKGRGSKVATALEKSSSLQVESAEHNFELNSSFELLQTGVAYWQYLGAYKNSIVFKENENRVRNVLQITQELVKADKKPAGDLVQIQADLANQERQTKIAEQNLYNARLNLGRIVGLSEIESEQLGIPEDEFPTITASGFKAGIDTKAMIKTANDRRKDIKAFKKTQEALDLQLNLASNNLKPQLDLTGFATYGGANMGNGVDQAFATISNKQGRNYTVGLRLNLFFPINNNLAKGTFVQNKTAVKDQQLAYNDLLRNIDLNVNIAHNNLKNSVLIVEKAAESLQYYQNVFDNEQVKFKNGLTTLLNLILFQERLTFAQRDYLQAQQQFAIAIINLRYETGTLISRQDTSISSAINRDTHYSIPNFNN